MTKTTFSLKIGFNFYLMTPADAAKVMEALSTSPCVTLEYLGGVTHYCSTDAGHISIEPFRGSIISREKRDELRAADHAEYERRWAERAEKADA